MRRECVLEGAILRAKRIKRKKIVKQETKSEVNMRMSVENVFWKVLYYETIKKEKKKKK